MIIKQAASRHGWTGVSRRLPALLFLSGILLVLAWIGLKGWRLLSIARSLQEHRERAEVLLADGLLQADPNQAEALVFDLRHDVAALDRELRPFVPLATHLGWLPRVGPLLKHSAALIEMADAGTEAAAYAARGLKPALLLLQDDQRSGGELFPQLLPVIGDAEADLVAASSALDRAAAARNQIESVEEFPWRVRTLLETIDGKLYLADELKLLSVMPPLLGVDEPRTYLILAQNEDEIRATGGFLTGVGVMTVDKGNIVDLAFQDANAIDDWRNKPYALPPDPLYRLMGLELFLFRDANFWPDFPTSARKAMELYRYGQEATPRLDGAIAIDQRFVAMLLAVTGPIPVPQLETTVRSNNVIKGLRDAWNADEHESHAEWLKQRKDFLGPLAQALRGRLLGNFEAIDPLFLADTMHQAASQKHLQIYVNDPFVAAVLDEIDWDGRLELPEAGDYLMVLDTNVGYNKANAVVQRAILYDVELHDQGTGTATLRVRYEHPGAQTTESCEQIVPYAEGIRYESLIDLCYWNYLRVYVPDGASPVQLPGSSLPSHLVPVSPTWFRQNPAEVQDEGSSTLISTAFVLPQGETLNNDFTYELPVLVMENGANKRYHLEVKKQAGADGQPLTVQVMVPPDATIVDTSPVADVDGRQATFDAELATDLIFEVIYR